MLAEDLQLSFAGLTCGKGTPYRIRQITGLMDFDTTAVDSPPGNRWGSIPSLDLADAATITIEFWFPNDPATVAALRAAFAPSEQYSGVVLVPLVWKWPGEVEKFRLARCRRRSQAMSHVSERTGGPVSMLVELNAPDPRAYATEIRSESIPAFAGDAFYLTLDQGSGTDLGFDMAAGSGADQGFNFSGSSGGGLVVLRNDGTSSVWGNVEFTAPAGLSRWRLVNLTTGDEANFEFGLSGPTPLVVDFEAAATPKTGEVVTYDGESRYSAWLHPRVPLAIPPGDSQWRFDVFEGDATNANAQITYSAAGFI